MDGSMSTESERSDASVGCVGSPRRLTVADVGGVVGVLGERRAALVAYARLFWRPAVNAAQAHRKFLTHLLGDGGGIGFASDSALLIAAPGRDGWVVDDAAVPEGDWGLTGRALWDALVGHDPGANVRFVCPVPEPDRAAFAESAGLKLTESWWHIEVPLARQPGPRRDPQVPDATALTVPAPLIYDPGGPILFLPDVADPSTALPAASVEAELLACPVVVVAAPAGDSALDRALTARGYRRHCDFYTGTLAQAH